MNDKIVTLNKMYYTGEAWFNLSVDFGFNSEDTSASIHIIKDEDFKEEMAICSQCGCEEYADEMRDGMCEDCYEDWQDDIKEQEEDED